ncbi:MAG: DUF58 domain-containing protein [Phycisphaerales bacterium]
MLVPSSTRRPETLGDLIGPDLLGRIDRLDVLSRKVFAGKLPGERRSRRRGQSVEFDDYRAYVPGDDLRRIDWNVFARLDRFFVKLFREDEDLGLHLVVDASPSMDAGDPSKLIFAQRLAMALGYIGLVNQNRVVATIIGAPGRPVVQRLAPIRGRRSLERLAGFLLERVHPGESGISGPSGGTGGSAARSAAPPGGGEFAGALRAVALARTGKGVMAVISDFLVREDLRAALNYLGSGQGSGGGFDTYALQVLSAGEIDPVSEGPGVLGDVRLIDAESGAQAEVTVSAATIKRYRQRLDDHVERLRSACAARGMTHALVRSDADLSKLLLDYLRRRGMLG